VVAIADTLDLDNPYFMGCSVGGQLSLDLAAERGDRFGAFISINGWYGNPELPAGFSNDTFRTPSIADSYAPALNFGATAPQAPEPNARSASRPLRCSRVCPSFASASVQSTRAGSDLAGTSRTRPPTQYADTWPSSQSTTAGGRSSAAPS